MKTNAGDDLLSVCMVLARYFPCEAGTETQCRRLNAALIARGIRVSVLTQALPTLPRNDVIESVPVFRRGIPNAGFAGSLLFFFAGLWWLLRNRRTFAVLHAHIASAPALLSAIAGKLLRKPVIIKFAGAGPTGDISTSTRTLHGRFKLAVLRWSGAHFVCPSTAIRDEMIAEGFLPARIRVIPNGIDTDAYAPASADVRASSRTTTGLPSTDPVILSCSRLEKGKGIEVLIDAWRILQERSPAHAAHLSIVGSGTSAEALHQQAHGLARLRWAGWVTAPLPWFHSADVFVLASFSEGMPNALLEAMACGIPCIVTAIPGITDMVTDQVNALLIPPGSAVALADAIQALLQDPARASTLGANARNRVLALSMANLAQQYAVWYQQLQSQRLPAVS